MERGRSLSAARRPPIQDPGAGIGGQIGLLLFDGMQLGSELLYFARASSARPAAGATRRPYYPSCPPSGTYPRSRLELALPCSDGGVSVPQGTAPRTSRY
jgi:hypothetical protein